MRIAVWDFPPADFILSGLTSGAVHGVGEVEVVRADRRGCAALLREGQVDLALVETLTVLRDVGSYDLVPGLALSSWRYPFARLVLRNGLSSPVRTVAFDPIYVQEILVARIALREHYGQEPAFVPYESPDLKTLMAAKEDGSLLVSAEAALLHTEALVLDLGQEWYELANYPMVWGLVAARKDEGTPEMIMLATTLAQAAEEQRGMWIQAREMTPDLHQFYSEDLRVRLDDLALASLTELRQHLFYYNVLDEVPDVSFITLPEDEQDSEDEEA